MSEIEDLSPLNPLRDHFSYDVIYIAGAKVPGIAQVQPIARGYKWDI